MLKKCKIVLLMVVFLISIFCTVPFTAVYAAGTTYYVDSVNGNDNNSGTSTASAWKTLSKVSSKTFVSGDKILLNRGQTFTGMCWPKGSGSSGSPITLGVYGTGSRPIISAGTNEAAIKLQNQQYWVIQSIETTGGDPRGISVENSSGAMLNYFRITDCIVHNVGGTDTTNPGNDLGKKQGLIVFWAENGSTGSHFNDIVVDGCTAHTTQRWAGITVYSNVSSNDTGASTNVTIQNCTVYDTYGEGIVAFAAKNWVILQNNVVHDIGNAPTGVIGTPNGIWTWRTNNATMRYNEVYNTHSPGVDGGAFDIDYYNTNNWVEYNYAHDCDGYGIAVFGALDNTSNSTYNGVTDNAVIRYNIFANNGRLAGREGSGQGDFYTLTWSGGSVNGVQIYNNTSYWNPAQNDPAVRFCGTSFSGANTKMFKNNIIYSTVSNLVRTDNSNVSFDNNLYWYTGAGSPNFYYNNTDYTSFSSYQSGSGQDAHGKFANPLLGSPAYHSNGKPTTQFTLQSGSPAINAGADVGGGSRDFLGNAAPQGGAYDIGACESSYTGVSIGTVLYYDDFESDTIGQNASGWEPNGGTWQISQPTGNSKEYQKTDTGDNVSLAGDSSWNNYYVQGYINLVDDTYGGICLLGRVQDTSHYYQLELKKDESGNKKWCIWKNNGGSWNEIASGAYSYSANTYYYMRLSMVGSSIQAYVSTDWGSTWNLLGGGTDTQYTSGKIGLRSWGSGGRFDVIKVVSQ